MPVCSPQLKSVAKRKTSSQTKKKNEIDSIEKTVIIHCFEGLICFKIYQNLFIFVFIFQIVL